MKDPVSSARAAHRALVIGCIGLLALALAGETGRRYASARHWLAALAAIDLDRWARGIQNRQGVVLNGPLLVSPTLREEAERAHVPIGARLWVREQVAVQVLPSEAQARDATLDTLLTRVFAPVGKPRLFHPDRHALRLQLRALFSELAADRAGPVIELTSAVLDFDASREVSRQALLRLEWSATRAGTPGAAAVAFARELPLTGTYRDEQDGFDGFVRTMHPALAGGDGPWTLRVRAGLAPVWDEIRDMTLASASAHVVARLDATRGRVSLPGLTLHRRQLLVPATLALLLLSCAVTVAVGRLDATTVSGVPWPRSLPRPPAAASPAVRRRPAAHRHGQGPCGIVRPRGPEPEPGGRARAARRRLRRGPARHGAVLPGPDPPCAWR